MTLSTEYRGYAISYSENEDRWNCYACKVSAETIGKVKAKIDAIHLKMRKAAMVRAYEINSNHTHGPELRECRLIDYLGEKWSGSWTASREVVDHRVSSMAVRDSGLGIGQRAGRQERNLSEIVAMTPKAEAQMIEAQRLHVIYRAAEDAYQAAIDGLPRLTLEDIAGLIKAAGAKVEEGDN